MCRKKYDIDGNMHEKDLAERDVERLRMTT